MSRTASSPLPSIQASSSINSLHQFTTHRPFSLIISTAAHASRLPSILKSRSSSRQDSSSFREKMAALRRSSRTPVPTKRAQQFLSTESHQSRHFPVVSESIDVKWVLNGEHVWWPATVTALHTNSDTDNTLRGRLLYSPQGIYSAEHADVIFTYSPSTNRRFVSSINNSSEPNEPSSWIFSCERTNEKSSPRSMGTENTSSTASDAAGKDTAKITSSRRTARQAQPVITKTPPRRRRSIGRYSSVRDARPQVEQVEFPSDADNHRLSHDVPSSSLNTRVGGSVAHSNQFSLSIQRAKSSSVLPPSEAPNREVLQQDGVDAEQFNATAEATGATSNATGTASNETGSPAVMTSISSRLNSLETNITHVLSTMNPTSSLQSHVVSILFSLKF